MGEGVFQQNLELDRAGGLNREAEYASLASQNRPERTIEGKAIPLHIGNRKALSHKLKAGFLLP